MKFVIAFSAVLAVAVAQFPNFGQPARYNPPRPVSPTPRPVSPTPRPSVAVVNRVSSNDQTANTIRYENDIRPDGSFTYVFETDNGIAAQAQGTPRDFGGNPPVVPVVHQGSFSWTSPEGQPIVMTYIADENGYQPSGDAIPTPHPIPEAILKSLEYNARNPQKN